MVKNKDKKLTVEKARKIVKKDRDERQIKAMRDMVVRFGDMPIYLLVAFMSFYVSVSSALWLYANNIHVFNKFFLTGEGSEVVYGFVLYGILAFITVGSIFLFSLFTYKAQLNLKYKYGYERPKGLVFKIFKKKEEDK
jgi:hypothetical protein